MVAPGECVNDVVTTCSGCKTKLNVDVYRSPAGYYIGFFCPNCGPYSRESGYYASYCDAKRALISKNYGR